MGHIHYFNTSSSSFPKHQDFVMCLVTTDRPSITLFAGEGNMELNFHFITC